MHKEFVPEGYLPVTTIKLYFSRRAAKKKKGEIYEEDENSNKNDESDSEAESEYETPDTTEEEKLGEERKVLNQKIGLAVNGTGIQKYEWIVVAYPRNQFPAQFLQFDPEQEEAQVYFLIRSTSSTKWFVWPELCGRKPDTAWIDEGIFDSHLIFSL